jgi:hypothetical protein
VNTYLPEDLARRVVVLAAELGRDVSELVAEALERHLAERRSA